MAEEGNEVWWRRGRDFCHALGMLYIHAAKTRLPAGREGPETGLGVANVVNTGIYLIKNRRTRFFPQQSPAQQPICVPPQKNPFHLLLTQTALYILYFSSPTESFSPIRISGPASTLQSGLCSNAPESSNYLFIQNNHHSDLLLFTH